MKKIIAIGIHISAGPSAGISASIPIINPSIKYNFIPNIQNPIIAIIASKTATISVASNISLAVFSIFSTINFLFSKGIIFIIFSLKLSHSIKR